MCSPRGTVVLLASGMFTDDIWSERRGLDGTFSKRPTNPTIILATNKRRNGLSVGATRRREVSLLAQSPDLFIYSPPKVILYNASPQYWYSTNANELPLLVLTLFFALNGTDSAWHVYYCNDNLYTNSHFSAHTLLQSAFRKTFRKDRTFRQNNRVIFFFHSKREASSHNIAADIFVSHFYIYLWKKTSQQ